MALRFRKSVKLAPGVRMNLSGGGSSFSFGPRGASVSVGKRGVYSNVSIPGLGISSRQKISGTSSQNQRPHGTSPQYVSLPASVEVQDDGQIFFKDQSGQPLSEGLIAIAKKQNADAIRGLIQSKCDDINAQVEAVGQLHADTPSPDDRPRFSPILFPHRCPLTPLPRPLGFLDKLFASRKAKVESVNAEAMQLHQRHVAEWEAAVAAHQQAEENRRKHIEELIYIDEEAMEAQLEQTLQDISWPRETLVASELVNGGLTVLIDVDLPEIEDMPNKIAAVPARGMKLSVKDISPTQLQRLYMGHVHSIGFRIIGEAFAALPRTEMVILSGYSQRRDKATGRLDDEYLYSVIVRRNDWKRIDFSEEGLRTLDVVEALSQFELRRSMSKTGIFKPIDPFTSDPLTS